MVPNRWAIGAKGSYKDLVRKYLPMEIHILDSTKMANPMTMVNTVGQVEESILENRVKIYQMVME